MFASLSKWTVVGFVVAAVGAPTAAADSPLGAKTEAAGYTAITKYLVRHAAQADTAALGAQTEAKGFLALQPKRVADVSQLGARTEAKGYRAIVRYQVQLAASPVISSPSNGFDWGDGLIGSGMTIGVFLIGAAAALAVRRRQSVARLRP
jgi:hypothetical protein